jgi:Asp-tRNA(Asn)/Glu-tRNA(Gln) amidotransferase A subunit family amidase
VAQADGMSVMALGSDTRGSIRQPAALCGVTGWKPTQRRVPLEGAFPLSYTLDTVGPLANSVACCAAYDEILAAEPRGAFAPLPVKGLRLLLPRGTLLDDLDAEVAAAFDAALRRLAAAGAVITSCAGLWPQQIPERWLRRRGHAIHRRWQDRLAIRPAHRQTVMFGKRLGANYIDWPDARRVHAHGGDPGGAL